MNDKTINLFLVLKTARINLETSDHWRRVQYVPGFADSEAEYLHRASVLIEIVEVYDCGSIGGWGDGQLRFNEKENRNINLKDRLEWLENKYLVEVI